MLVAEDDRSRFSEAVARALTEFRALIHHAARLELLQIATREFEERTYCEEGYVEPIREDILENALSVLKFLDELVNAIPRVLDKAERYAFDIGLHVDNALHRLPLSRHVFVPAPEQDPTEQVSFSLVNAAALILETSDVDSSTPTLFNHIPSPGEVPLPSDWRSMLLHLWDQLRGVATTTTLDQLSFTAAEGSVTNVVEAADQFIRCQLAPSKIEATPAGEWSKPMSKTDMRVLLGNLSPRKFETFTKTYPLRNAGNRQQFQIRLDGMDAAMRKKLA